MTPVRSFLARNGGAALDLHEELWGEDGVVSADEEVAAVSGEDWLLSIHRSKVHGGNEGLRMYM